MTDIEKLVEECAQAAFDTDDNSKEWDKAPEHWKPPYRVIARAVIRRTLEAAANDLAGLTNAEILLAAGEMTAGELRSVRAVLNWQSGHLRTLAASIGGNT